MAKVYLDNNATTSIDPSIIELIVNSLKNHFGNPSSTHSFGRASRSVLNQARKSIADFFSFKPQEVIFTSGGTESINMILRGFCNHPPGHLITSNLEHSAVFATMPVLESMGWEVSYLPSGPWGAIFPEDIKRAIKTNTRLISLMAVNNETGVKTDVEAIAKICLEAGIPFVVDGVAWLGKESFTIHPGVAAICFSGHKIHAPKGIGLALVRNSLKLSPLITGGEQEFGKRGGTENLSGIVALAEAIRLLKQELPAAGKRMERLRNKFEASLIGALSDGSVNVTINGLGERISNTSNLCFEGIDGETLLLALDQEGVAASLGSACASGAIEPSRVLLNMGLSLEKARSSLRFSLSRFTTDDEIERAVEAIIRCVISIK